MRNVIWLIPLLLVGCRSWMQTVEVPVYLHDTVRTVEVQHDSTYVDRWHTQYVKGDTIYITDEVTKTKIVTKIDTAYRYIETPVTITTTETVEVEKPLTWWQRTFIYIGVGTLALLVLWVLWKVWLRRLLPTKLPTKNGN